MFFEHKYGCNFCGHSFERFVPWPDLYDFPRVQWEMYNKHTAICPHCYSLDRERLYKLYIERETGLLKPGTRVLHVAPEKNLRVWLSCNSAIEYLCGDLEPSDPGMVKLDITNLPFEDCRFDAFICSHVLEHVIDDMQAMRELHRILKVGGWGIVQVPIALNLERTYEDFSVTSPEERQEVFGQWDHVRIYAPNFTDRLKTAGFHVNIFNYGQKYGPGEAEKWGLSANDNLYVAVK